MYVSVSGIDFGFSEHNVIQPNGKINANLAECFFNNTGWTIELVEELLNSLFTPQPRSGLLHLNFNTILHIVRMIVNFKLHWVFQDINYL